MSLVAVASEKVTATGTRNARETLNVETTTVYSVLVQYSIKVWQRGILGPNALIVLDLSGMMTAVSIQVFQALSLIYF